MIKLVEEKRWALSFVVLSLLILVGCRGAETEVESEQPPNLIGNGDFSKELSDAKPKANGVLDSKNSWVYHQNSQGQGGAVIKNETAKVRVENSGINPWSVQLLQAPVTLNKSAEYKVVFQAKAEKKAKIHLKLGATSSRAWVGYQEKSFELTSELKTYQCDFVMEGKTDQQARFEFWFLNQTNYTLDNVQLIKVKAAPVSEDKVEIKSSDEKADLSFYDDSSLSIEQKVDKILGLMTLDEKIGQMTQAERKHVSPEEVKKYHLGSILSGGGSTPKENRPQDWIEMYNGFQKGALQGRLEIPLIYGVDAVHGHNNLKDATIFPHNIGLGAMGKGLMAIDKSQEAKELMEEIASVTAQETAATGMDWNFAPAVSVVRDERWGRSYESYGETTELQKLLAGPYVKGLQGSEDIIGKSKGHVVATAKHFIGDGATKWGTGDANYPIDRGKVNIDLAELKRLHGQGYREAIAEDVGTIMISYNSYQGTKMHAHRELIQNYLKVSQNEGGLGFDGFVISDWAAIHEIDAETHYDKVVKSVNAGIDMFMEPDDWHKFMIDLKTAVKKGDVKESRINDAVRRILKIKFKAGLFKESLADNNLVDSIGSQEHRATAREAVRKSLVLLKNENNLLPLSKGDKFYITGSNADNLGNQCGGWTIKWQGFSGNQATEGTTIKGGIEKLLAKNEGKVVNNLDDADVAIAVVGEKAYAEGKGDDSDLQLSDQDITKLQEIEKSGKKVVVILAAGRPLIVTDQIANWDAFVTAWLPGTEGQGVADVIFGDYNFTGKLAISWPKTVNQLPLNVGDENYNPLFEYGYGLKMELNN